MHDMKSVTYFKYMPYEYAINTSVAFDIMRWVTEPLLIQQTFIVNTYDLKSGTKIVGRQVKLMFHHSAN